MKKVTRIKKNDLFSNWIYRILLFFLLVGACFSIASYSITTYFRDQEPNINEALQEYLTSSFSSNINNLYIYDIDKVMEDFMHSSAVTGFFFCSEQYPAAEELITHLTNQLTSMTIRSEYITAAAIYASASNTFVASQTDKIDNTQLDTLLNDMIYSYNSSSLDKNKLASDGFNTFLFKYEDYVVFSKDLTTLSGSSYSTMFFLLDPEAFAAFIYRANGTIPYKVSIYDPHNVLLFTNSAQSRKTNYTQLINFTTEDISSIPNGSSNYIYTKSDITGLQYLLEMEQLPLPGNTRTSPLLYASLLLALVLLSCFILFSLYHYYQKSLKQIQQAAGQLKISSADTFSAFTDQVQEKVAQLSLENSTLHRIIEATSAEAASHLFMKLIAGETVEAEETRITLSSTGYGFRLDDIYIAGIVHQTINDFISADIRYRILNMLNSIFEKFKGKNPCTLCAFSYDEKSFVIIASFPAGTSIAKGKARINALTQQIEEGLNFLKAPMAVAFGHMYSSILDLSFSYNEAFKAMHYQAVALTDSPLQTLEAEIPDIVPETTDEGLSHEHSQEPQISQLAETSDTADRIDRRAAQVAQLIWENKEDGLPSLIERILSNVFESDDLNLQEEMSRRLISAVTSHMISYPYVNDSLLSNVSDDLSLLMQSETTSEELKYHLSEALNTLCHDFSEALKKQRNPYITSAKEYIEQNYSNPDLSLEEIAENLKIAPNYLSTIFSKNLGIKLFEYVNEYRLEKSIDMLLHTDKTVNDISLECGFGSSRNYIRIFKKYKDNTPGAYRKQHLTQG